jgi:triosephosphate isomerase
MRTPIIAGNWKMYKNPPDSVEFANALKPRLEPFSNVERVVCPTFLALAGVAIALQGSPIKVGAQNCHYKTEGAYTSQIAAAMLTGLAEYIVIGHSEVRAYLKDTDTDVNLKVVAALSSGIKPILAVGESIDQRKAGQTDAIISAQTRVGLVNVSAAQMANIVIAYEPIWAIGTGENCDPAEAQRVIGNVIRGTLRDLYGTSVADIVRIQYGGSVKPDNLAAYMAQPDIDGALVGGASLKVDDFASLVQTASQAKGA